MKKIIILLLSTIMVASLIGCGGSEQPSSNKEDVSQKSENKKEEFDISKVELTKENVENLCKDLLSERLKAVEISDGDIKITEHQDDIISEKEIVTKSSQHAINVIEKLFSNSNVNSVTFTTLAKFKDASGNEKDNTAVEVKFSKETAQKINWSNMAQEIYGNCKSLVNAADSSIIHPVILKNLK